MDDIKNFYEVIVDVWKFFKKHYEDFDSDVALQDIYKFEQKYMQKKYGPRVYDLAMRTIKMWWKEAGEIHEVRKKRNASN